MIQLGSSELVVGVDVGGLAKGFHAVALRNQRVTDKVHVEAAREIRDWCSSIGATTVGIDAPCRPSLEGYGRAAERALAGERIFSFLTPTHDVAVTKAFYAWMLHGWELYGLLEPNYPLFTGGPIIGRTCFETFPHAVACALAGEVVSAKKKRVVRRALLRGAGVDDSALSNIDEVDATLCALAANSLKRNAFRSYGDPLDGLIVVPLKSVGVRATDQGVGNAIRQLGPL